MRDERPHQPGVLRPPCRVVGVHHRQPPLQLRGHSSAGCKPDGAARPAFRRAITRYHGRRSCLAPLRRTGVQFAAQLDQDGPPLEERAHELGVVRAGETGRQALGIGGSLAHSVVRSNMPPLPLLHPLEGPRIGHQY